MTAAAAELACAVTVAGPGGPEIVRKLRDLGLNCSVLFDGMGHAAMDLPAPADWVGAQRAVGAACPLLLSNSYWVPGGRGCRGAALS